LEFSANDATTIGIAGVLGIKTTVLDAVFFWSSRRFFWYFLELQGISFDDEDMDLM